MTPTPTRAECPCPSCGRITTARNTLEGTEQTRECPRRRCGCLFSAVLEATQTQRSGNRGVIVDD
nr:hypothetical protein [Halocatena marina]